MSVLGVGVDIVETQRIEHSLERFGERFLHRVFTENEIAYCQSMKHSARHFAARFAGKEAVSKAFGTGIGEAIGWREIDIHRRESGEPYVILHGGAETLASERGVGKIWLSLSHTDHYAAATAMIES